jgi:predicted component of type VI protein secretion system
MAYLTIHLEDKPVTRRELEPGTAMILGRALESDLWIDDTRLSRLHCRFESSDDDGAHWTVIDLNSRNGTHVNGQRIGSHRLRDGEEIFVGRARLVFHAGAIPKARPKDPGQRDTAVATMRDRDPGETLVDSRFGMPGFPSPKPREMQKTGDDDDGGAPLAFRRPPAQPIVEADHHEDLPRGRNWLRALFRKRPRHRTHDGDEPG